MHPDQDLEAKLAFGVFTFLEFGVWGIGVRVSYSPLCTEWGYDRNCSATSIL